MKANRRGFLKRTAAGLAALWAVDPAKILKVPEEELEEPVEADQVRHPYHYVSPYLVYHPYHYGLGDYSYEHVVYEASDGSLEKDFDMCNYWQCIICGKINSISWGECYTCKTARRRNRRYGWTNEGLA